MCMPVHVSALSVSVQYMQLVREQQEANRVLFEAEKDKAVADLKAGEEYEEFRKKVRRFLCEAGYDKR